VKSGFIGHQPFGKQRADTGDLKITDLDVIFLSEDKVNTDHGAEKIDVRRLKLLIRGITRDCSGRSAAHAEAGDTGGRR
jgi:hypothetical protein